MKKVYQELLKVFKKADKARREQIAKEWGKANAEEMLNFLNSKLNLGETKTEAGVSVKSKKQPKKEINVIIDTPVSKVEEEKVQPVDKVICFDTTGSMGAYIGSVKNHVKELIPNLFRDIPNLRLKIVAFGDYEDMKSPTKFDKAYQVLELTDNQNELIKFVENAKNTHGGDTDEFYELVIKKVVEETGWREGANKSVLFIADYTPHEVGYRHRNLIGSNQIDWRIEAKKAADLGIQFDTLSIHNYPWYKELSQITNGVHMQFSSANKTSELVIASTLVRSSSSSARTSYMASMDAAFTSGDEELIGMYKSLNSKLD
jgi:hypothetical protein